MDTGHWVSIALSQRLVCLVWGVDSRSGFCKDKEETLTCSLQRWRSSVYSRFCSAWCSAYLQTQRYGKLRACFQDGLRLRLCQCSRRGKKHLLVLCRDGGLR